MTSVSAFGNQAALFIPRLRKAGHDVALFALGGSAGATCKTPDGMTVYPTVGDPRGNDVVALHAKAHRADIVLTLGDPHVFSPEVYQNLPWLAWAPLDFETPTAATVRSLNAARWIWSPSKHGCDAYRAVIPPLRASTGISDNIAHVPHGVDSKTFCLHEDVGRARRVLGDSLGVNLAGRFLVVSVGANKGTPARKGWYELFSAFKVFAAATEALLYLHTEIRGIAGGEDLLDVIDIVGLDRDLVCFPPQYEYLSGTIPFSGLTMIYNAADVFLSASHGEGFLLPAYEAQLCGTSIILPRNTAQTEACLSEHTGKLVRTVAYHPFDGATTWRRPIVGEIALALESVRARALLGWGNDRAQTRAKAMEFDVDRVFERCVAPALVRIAEEIGKDEGWHPA